ncbi:MAG: tripartite tricarboxylate transporter TctB family protein [Gammaproteobacteria bacterium]
MTPHVAQAAPGVTALGLGLLIAWDALHLPSPPTAGALGPAAAPWLLAAGFAAIGVLLLWRAPAPTDVRTTASTQRLTRLLGLLVAGGVTLIAVGFTPAGTLLFAGTARVFGSRSPVRDLLLGGGIAVLLQFTFTRLFGLPLGGLWLDGP